MVVLLICTAFLVCSIVKNPFGEHDVMLALAITAGFIALEKIDFVANMGSKRYYIQSAFSLPDDEKKAQEKASLINVNDSFKKIIIVKDVVKPLHDNDGILTMSIYDFLLNEHSLEL